MKEETDAILRAFGDILLQLGCDTGWLVPNTSLNTKQLNASIAAYQQLLDGMELEISQALYQAQAREAKPEPEPVPTKVEPASPQIDKVDGVDTKVDFDNLDSKFTDGLGNELGEEIDFYDMNSADNLGLFGVGGMPEDSKLDDGYGMIDDQYF